MGNKVKGIRKFGSPNEPQKFKGYKSPDISYRDTKFGRTGLTSSFDSVEDLRAARSVADVYGMKGWGEPGVSRGEVTESNSDRAARELSAAMTRARERNTPAMSQAYIDNLDTNKAVLEGKGEKGQRCNRTACQAPGAYWFNHSTRAYYCGTCADIINNESKRFKDSYLDDLGHDLLTLDPDFADKADERA